MIAQHRPPGRRPLRPHETRHRRPRAFDDSAEQFDEWMAACPGEDTPYSSASS